MEWFLKGAKCVRYLVWEVRIEFKVVDITFVFYCLFVIHFFYYPSFLSRFGSYCNSAQCA